MQDAAEGAAAGEGAEEHPAEGAEDLPPGVSAATSAAPAAPAAAPPPAGKAAASKAAGKAPAAPAAPAEPGSDEWKFDPNSGLFYQLSSSAYYDGNSGKYFKDGGWFDSLG